MSPQPQPAAETIVADSPATGTKEHLPDWIEDGMDRLRDQPERAERLRQARLDMWREMVKRELWS